jgi:hypothetical protein
VSTGTGPLLQLRPGSFLAPRSLTSDHRQMQIGRINIERRKVDRRHRAQGRFIAGTRAFDRDERRVFSAVERRRTIRRAADVRRVVARAG